MDREPEPKMEETGGKNHKRYTAKKRDVTIVGKIYAYWCGHCQALKPEWKKMKHIIHKKKGKKHLVFAEIEEKESDSALRKLEKDHRVTISSNGYPTLFRIEKDKVVYYEGDRTADKMSEWYLRGGGQGQGVQGEQGEPKLPGIMMDQQGGRTLRSRRYNKSKPNGKTRKSTRKNTGGLFGFVFGKN
jgi:thiol-disulfide isomerase/thioredoxin